ncbi:2Fe-2S iron-sulfur cluster binding domain-containing protein (plasmid) [Rhodococcus pseudokoreensis]|uniref:2Fe-2S iron-sulfur cluster binding domain-containing protein n=1 Tax=Rhodococcus pseudokoreensis TaxID=2811421 RepID=A0A974VZ66_9NOCA|nr:2Fe-2S iron-sulfur cluster binding domain-containing protein [Rhodococcus pseudokoreensis]QSE87438.1 2Fe-2S iron-sulfur cluster binding domain-containing protein [Rhodococcus pseudokoreensis]
MARFFGRGRGRGPSEPRTVTISPTGRVFEAPGTESILNEALAAGIPFPYSCTVGTCGTCKSKLIRGRVREIVYPEIALTAEELSDGYILCCQSVARTSLDLDVAGLSEMPDHQLVTAQGTISAQRSLMHDVTEIVVTFDSDLEYSASQYAELRLADVTGPRSYSFAEAQSDVDHRRVTFYVRHVPGGEFTDWLFSADRVGTELSVAGPFGDLWLRPSESPILCVAGGSELAPIKALLEEASRHGCDREAVLVFGARAQQDLYCLNEIDDLSTSWTGSFAFQPVLSQESPDSDWTGARGLVTSVLSGLSREFLNSCHVYTCGPPVMIDALEDAFREVRSGSKYFYVDRFVTRICRCRPVGLSRTELQVVSCDERNDFGYTGGPRCKASGL